MALLREKKDALLLLVFVANTLLYGIFFWQFEKLSWAALTALGFLLCMLICTNYQCLAHNFIHNPFFVSDKLNTLFSLLNSPLLGIPQSMYKVHHLNHHRYNNDKRDPQTQTTKDHTSLYRHSSHPDHPENILSYSIVGVLRTDMFELYQLSKHPNWAKNLETLMCLAPFALSFGLGGANLLAAYTTVWFLGQSMALAENYLEHYGATPGNRMTDSVSCYSKFYNLVWFNNGYHQEHHLKPTIHWSKIPSVRKQLPQQNRRIVPFAHFTTFFIPLEDKED